MSGIVAHCRLSQCCFSGGSGTLVPCDAFTDSQKQESHWFLPRLKVIWAFLQQNVELHTKSKSDRGKNESQRVASQSGSRRGHQQREEEAGLLEVSRDGSAGTGALAAPDMKGAVMS